MGSDLRFEVEGLSEALRALSRVERELAPRAREVLRAGAKLIQADAQGRLGAGGGTYPKRRGMIGVGVSARGADVELNASTYPWARGAEFGAKRAWVFGRVMTQGRLRRRQFPVWRGNQFVVRGVGGPGWLIQPAIRAQLPRIERLAADGVDELIDEEMSRGRVPRG